MTFRTRVRTEGVPAWAALVCAVLAVLFVSSGKAGFGGLVTVSAQTAAQPAPAAPDQAEPQEPAAGGRWDFGDEEDEEAPSFLEDVRAQALDLSMLVAFTVLAFVSFFRKSKPLKYVTFVASVAYIGFYKSTLMSIVNVFGLFGGNLPIFRYNLAWYLLAAITIVSTVLWGRVYCGRICAFGALTQLLDAVVPARVRVNVPRVLERRASYIKFGILAFALSYFIVTKDPLIYPYIEPFWMFGIYGRSAPMWIGLAVLLVATVFVRNLYCRFLCPLGAFLGLISHLTVFRIKRWAECNHCRICQKACEWGAIQGPKILQTECVRCDDCERLYDDTTRCPHHLILIRKADILARRAARAEA